LGVAVALGLLIASGAGADQANRVRVGALKFGTVNWELDVVRSHGLATREGVDLQVVPLASKGATNVAVQGGAVDLIVSDWIWVSRQRAGVLALEERLLDDYPQLLSGLTEDGEAAGATDASAAVNDARIPSS
jgi:hypothetical protein